MNPIMIVPMMPLKFLAFVFSILMNVLQSWTDSLRNLVKEDKQHTHSRSSFFGLSRSMSSGAE